jgi:hypothetical protein
VILPLRNRIVAVAWAGQVAVIVASLGVRSYPNLSLLILILAWLSTAVVCITFSRGWRIAAVLLVVLSGIAMKDTMMYLLLAIACARGSCV